MAIQKHDRTGVRVAIVCRGYMLYELLTCFVIGTSVHGELAFGKPREIKDNIAMKSFSREES